MDCQKFSGKFFYQHPNSDSSLFGPIVKKHFKSFSQRYCHLRKPSKVYFFNWLFLGIFATSPTQWGPKFLPNPEIPNGTVFVRVLPSHAQLVVLLQHHAKTATSAFPPKVVFFSGFEFAPLPVVSRGIFS